LGVTKKRNPEACIARAFSDFVRKANLFCNIRRYINSYHNTLLQIKQKQKWHGQHIFIGMSYAVQSNQKHMVENKILHYFSLNVMILTSGYFWKLWSSWNLYWIKCKRNSSSYQKKKKITQSTSLQCCQTTSVYKAKLFCIFMNIFGFVFTNHEY